MVAPKVEELGTAVRVGGRGRKKLYVTEIKYDSSFNHGASGFQARGLVESDTNLKEGEKAVLFINGKKVSTGPINLSVEDDENLVTIEVLDAKRILNVKQVNANLGVQEKGSAPAGMSSGGNPYLIAEDLFESAGVKHAVNDDIEEDNIPSGIPLPTYFIQAKNKTYSKALDKLCQKTGGVWYVDESNVCHFRLTKEPFEHHDVHSILSFDAGEQDVPWKTVHVVGRKSERRGAKQHSLLGKKKIVGEAGTGEKPIYTYRANHIKDKKDAKEMAGNILEAFKRKRGKGKAKIVGDERLRPGDFVTFPSQFDMENYGVKSVSHFLNDQDGFITKVDLFAFLGNDEEFPN